MNKDIMICGVGGQGTVLASKIIAAAATQEGQTVHSAETIGMAQRGGSVTSHVRIGDKAHSPLIPPGSADIILAFEPSEAVRNLRYLKAGGLAVVNTAPVKPVTESLKETGYDGKEMTAYLRRKCRCIFIDSDEVCAPFGSAKFFNIIILGVACATGETGIGKDVILNQIDLRVPEKFRETNRLAFLAGYEIGEKEKKQYED